MPTEKQIENSNRRFAKKLGLLFEKFTSPAKRAVPDRLVSPTEITGDFIPFFIEYKATGKAEKFHRCERGEDPETVFSKTQGHEKKQFQDHEVRRGGGVPVFVVDDKEEGQRILERNGRYIDGYDSLGRKL